MNMTTKRIVLRFPKRLAGKPIVYKLAKDFDLEFTILKADVTPDEEGKLILELHGDKENYKAGLNYIKEAGVSVEPLSKDITRNDEACANCGVCVPLCPSNTFGVDSKTRQVDFREETCVVCGLCVQICPFNAMAISY
jgi:ferredoxin